MSSTPLFTNNTLFIFWIILSVAFTLVTIIHGYHFNLLEHETDQLQQEIETMDKRFEVVHSRIDCFRNMDTGNYEGTGIICPMGDPHYELLEEWEPEQ